MKPLYKNLAGLLSIVFLSLSLPSFSQDSAKGNVSIGVNYFIDNNTIPYLLVKVKTKIDGRFKPVSDIHLKLFLNKDSAGTQIGEVVTNNKGEASITIPPALKSQWGTSLKHTFLATFAGSKKFNEASGDLTVGKAKILIDTTNDKKVVATVFEMKDTAWVPVKGVEVLLGIKRMDADLSVNETATFTTDSTGQASADFKRDSIPGDANGNIILVAKVLDNDQYGNLRIEKTVSWGAKFIPVSTFGERSLFATRGKAPIWLILMATSIVVVVWGILISLVINLFKIKKLGQQAS